MKNKEQKLNKINIIMFITLCVVVASIVIYRLFNPIPPLERRACMDRLNKLAIFQAKIYEKTGAYSSELQELSRDNTIHFYHSCPLTGEKFIVETSDSGYTIKCREHKHYIKNNILYKN